MCKPLSEGGQRCASHARAQVSKCATIHRAQQSEASFNALQYAYSQFASTPTGQREVERNLARGVPAPDPPRHTDRQHAHPEHDRQFWAKALEDGKQIRQVNTDVAAAIKRGRQQRERAAAERVHARLATEISQVMSPPPAAAHDASFADEAPYAFAH